MSSEIAGECSGRACGFGVYGGEVNCDTGSGSCWTAMMADAGDSAFHDKTLQDATRAIKAILDKLPQEQNGRKLSFVHTEDGTILAWVNHGKPFPEGTVTLESGRDKVIEALNLKVPTGT